MKKYLPCRHHMHPPHRHHQCLNIEIVYKTSRRDCVFDEKMQIFSFFSAEKFLMIKELSRVFPANSDFLIFISL